ncbi:MAG: hypothetical protein QMD85_05240, partial [Candidatus Aenigmarchaeota archaeon]|nr:hypothetical protein [Candidatus Aenigmarchaeota archaeon]MDI6722969.1 hypothetical protein [Candidatus Aenigmarchaeota archaeon]
FDPESLYKAIEENKSSGLHTLVLLDIGMTAKEGAELMIRHKSVEKNSMVIACFMLGDENQKILYGTADNLIIRDVKDIPCCIIVPGRINFKEQEFLELWKT